MSLSKQARFRGALDGTRARMAPGRERNALTAVLDYLGGAEEPMWSDLPWRFFRDGLEIVPLSPSDGVQAEAALLRYQAGASVPYHIHTGDEHVLVLDGSQQDEQGRYPTGTVMLNPAGTGHSVSSPEGCVVGILWEKPVLFP
jgi:anti-sigma factor ChrR (cupin superfamily)